MRKLSAKKYTIRKKFRNVKSDKDDLELEKYDNCSYCGGRVSERVVQKNCRWGDNLIAIIENVPAGVCELCGERYYKSTVLKKIERMLEDRKDFEHVNIPSAEFIKSD